MARPVLHWPVSKPPNSVRQGYCEVSSLFYCPNIVSPHPLINYTQTMLMASELLHCHLVVLHIDITNHLRKPPPMAADCHRLRPWSEPQPSEHTREFMKMNWGLYREYTQQHFWRDAGQFTSQ
jgi:hypothetical protein